MTVLGDIGRALGQIGDARFQRVFFTGLGLTVLLLVVFTWAVAWLTGWLLPDTVRIPFVGEIGWLDDLASGASVLVMLLLSTFLMVPVASAFTSLFLDDVTDAVEAEHYPALPPAPRLGLVESLIDGAGFLATLLGLNLAALLVYVVFAPAAPLIFWALNGWLLGREYVQLIAARRLGREGARDFRRRHRGQIWLGGILMAVPLSVPVLNLAVPVLGAASFTHLYHRLSGARYSGAAPSGRTGPDRGPR